MSKLAAIVAREAKAIIRNKQSSLLRRPPVLSTHCLSRSSRCYGVRAAWRLQLTTHFGVLCLFALCGPRSQVKHLLGLGPCWGPAGALLEPCWGSTGPLPAWIAHAPQPLVYRGFIKQCTGLHAAA